MAAIDPSILLEPFSEHVYEFPTNAIDAVIYLGALFRLLSFFNLLLGAFGLLLLWRWRLGYELWILRSLIGLTVSSYLGPVVFDNTVGAIGFFEIIEHIVFLAALALGIVMLSDSRPRAAAESG
jgi:hypothetical protein